MWRAYLTTTADGLTELLSIEERLRAARIVRTEARARWARSRGILRSLLGRYLDRDPRSLCFEVGPHGKPELRNHGNLTHGLHFNLSHSGELVLVAVTAGCEVGVDIERIREGGTGHLDELAIAKRLLGPAQAKRLRALEPDVRAAQFLRAWTLREAALKCVGAGFACSQAADDQLKALWTASVDVGPRAFAAVAAQSHQKGELRCWQWPG